MDLDAHVRAADFDRWASSRLVSDTARRDDLIALYAFEAELAAIPTRVSQPILAEMRYSWWAEQIPGVTTGEPRKGHPILERLSGVVRRHAVEASVLEGLIQAHIERVHGAPHDRVALYVRPMQQAARILAGPDAERPVEGAGRVWALIQTGDLAEAQAARGPANADLADLAVAAFPAVAHATLRDPGAPESVRRLRLAWAALWGRI